ncbi:hypothetical protein D1614_14125 [Maribellus luteus]|uniref:Uncharacterized protein n=1 Tax=Maribellus luteus TaxID=2305463 RepID=A0A399SYI1_9BACT|nr:hypothetical protein [Maribellus luteus]RIJ47712.1 hypothetical protein D1614_14125 [Maribellus luteus]
MNTKDRRIHHQLKLYNNYNHITVTGVLVVFGFLMLIGIPVFPKNLILSLLFFCLAFIAHKNLKTTKPVSITKNSISLGKMVNGYAKTTIDSKSINRIDLVDETKIEFRSAAKFSGGEVKIYSNYYLFHLKDKSEIRFDNLYDKQLQVDLMDWCRNNSIEFNQYERKIKGASKKNVGQIP